MNDWLSEIEGSMERWPSLRPKREVVERMARVIRELVALIKLLTKKYIDALVLHYTHGVKPMDAELKEALDNLSPDAKELLG